MKRSWKVLAKQLDDVAVRLERAATYATRIPGRKHTAQACTADSLNALGAAVKVEMVRSRILADNPVLADAIAQTPPAVAPAGAPEPAAERAD